MMFFDNEAFGQFCADAVMHYHVEAPTVSEYLDGLYTRVYEGEPVQLAEIVAVQTICENGVYMHPNYAANYVYKLKARLGMDTTGDPGF